MAPLVTNSWSSKMNCNQKQLERARCQDSNPRLSLARSPRPDVWDPSRVTKHDHTGIYFSPKHKRLMSWRTLLNFFFNLVVEATKKWLVDLVKDLRWRKKIAKNRKQKPRLNLPVTPFIHLPEIDFRNPVESALGANRAPLASAVEDQQVVRCNFF